MSETRILIVPTDVVGQYQKTKLRKAGIEVIECDSPQDIRLLSDDIEVDGNSLFWAAMQALKQAFPADKAVMVDRISELIDTKHKARQEIK